MFPTPLKFRSTSYMSGPAGLNVTLLPAETEHGYVEMVALGQGHNPAGFHETVFRKFYINETPAPIAPFAVWEVESTLLYLEREIGLLVPKTVFGIPQELKIVKLGNQRIVAYAPGGKIWFPVAATAPWNKVDWIDGDFSAVLAGITKNGIGGLQPPPASEYLYAWLTDPWERPSQSS